MSEKPGKTTAKTEIIKLEFNAVKLAALRQATEKKGLKIESELLDYLEKMYQKHVPGQVKEFISLSGF